MHDLERALRFYELLGFKKTAGPLGPEPVAILNHPSGVELNLILNAPSASAPNVLMDVAEKHPGIKRDKGKVGFQSYNTRVEFRNIYIKELP